MRALDYRRSLGSYLHYSIRRAPPARVLAGHRPVARSPVDSGDGLGTIRGLETAIAYQSRRRALILVNCFALALACHRAPFLPKADVYVPALTRTHFG